MRIPPDIPRRWTVEIDGIRFLARMIDKARMEAAGTLGSYLCGHSPIDRDLMTLLGVTKAQFIELVTAVSSDADILAALRSRGFDESAVRAWSRRLPAKFAIYLRLADLDEGYVRPTALEVPLVKLLTKYQHPLMALTRKVLPAP